MVSDPRQTEVCELDVPVPVNEDVGAFEVAVENLFLVQVDHGLGDVDDDLYDAVDADLDHLDVDEVVQTAVVHVPLLAVATP